MVIRTAWEAAVPSSNYPIPAPAQGHMGWCLGRAASSPSIQATVGIGLCQPPGPVALVKNTATYKNIYILTPYKLLTIDTQTAAGKSALSRGQER